MHDRAVDKGLVGLLQLPQGFDPDRDELIDFLDLITRPAHRFSKEALSCVAIGFNDFLYCRLLPLLRLKKLGDGVVLTFACIELAQQVNHGVDDGALFLDLVPAHPPHALEDFSAI